MKVFDVVGALVVATWVIFASLYVYDVESSQSAARGLGEGFDMQDGETWLILRRDDKEAGFVHQTRTELADGWLIEYDMVMMLDLLGTSRSIETHVKSRLDHQGYLDEFSADINASGRVFKASGEVDDTALNISLDMGAKPRTQTIELDEKPRLSSSALNQLLASGRLEAGDEFKERYFNPTTMQMTEMVMRYQGREDVEILEETVSAHFIVQQVAGNELDVYVDDDGEILIQEFPMRMVGSRVPGELGRARASAIRQRFEEQKDRPAAPEGDAPSFDLGLDTALDLLGGQSKPAELTDEASPADEPSTDEDSPDDSDAPDPVPTPEKSDP